MWLLQHYVASMFQALLIGNIQDRMNVANRRLTSFITLAVQDVPPGATSIIAQASLSWQDAHAHINTYTGILSPEEVPACANHQASQSAHNG